MELKRYVLLTDNRIVNKDIDEDYVERDGMLYGLGCIDYPCSSNEYGEIEQTSDNILDLIRQGDLVNYKGHICEIMEDEPNIFYFDFGVGRYYLYQKIVCEEITMLYKKVVNNYIGYEAK